MQNKGVKGHGPGVGVAFVALLFGGAAWGQTPPHPSAPSTNPPPTSSPSTTPSLLKDIPTAKSNKKKYNRPVAILNTEQGPIVIELYPEEAPATVENFMTLVNKGFYKDMVFHRVENFVIQTGDPKGDGSGGPGYTIPNEENRNLKHIKGAVGMANSGRNTAGSQFYILTKPTPQLDTGEYTLFGRVVAGQNIADRIKRGEKLNKVTIELPEGYKTGPTREATSELMLPPVLPENPGNYKPTVRVKVEIGTVAGAPSRVELKRKSGSASVDSAVLEALRQWKWNPALKKGEAVKSTREFDYDLTTGSVRYD